MRKEIDDYLRLAGKLESKPVDTQFTRYKEMADVMMDRYGIHYTVIKGSGYQIWAKSIADKTNVNYVYDTSTSVSVGGSDDI